MLTAIVISLFLPEIIYDYSTALKQAGKRVIRIYAVIMLISFVILILYSFKITIPSPHGIITKVIGSLFRIET